VAIHPTAIVKSGAKLADDVSIGEYAYVGALVTVGCGCVIGHHATVDGRTTLAEGNIIHSYAYIGGPTHDLKYAGGEPGLEIGSRNVFREFCTVHVGTKPDTSTIVGSGNTFLADSPVAHDWVVGNHVIMSSQAALGGHITVDNYANIGWSTGIHQFCKEGKYAMVGTSGKAVQDILPFMLADGNPSKVRCVNAINLQRHGFSEEEIADRRRIFKIFSSRGLNRRQAVDALIDPETDFPFREIVLAFISKSTRGLA
jgi:UDP-N-acetylglucosamine acyltransferase